MPQNVSTDDLQRIQTGANLSKDRPTLSVRPNRDGYITKSADRKYFADVEHVAVYVDGDQGLLALEPIPDRHLDALPRDEILALGRESDLGAVVSLKSAFNAMDVPEDRFPVEKSRHYDLERHEDLLVADVSDILEDAGVLPTADADSDDEDEDEDDDSGASPPVPDAAEESGETTTRHVNRHSGDDDEGEGEDLRGFTEEKLAEVAAEADTIAEYADLLGVPEGIARKLAMDTDVYHTLRDNPGGAYRGGVTND